jgi:hypothetical protein
MISPLQEWLADVINAERQRDAAEARLARLATEHPRLASPAVRRQARHPVAAPRAFGERLVERSVALVLCRLGFVSGPPCR